MSTHSNIAVKVRVEDAAQVKKVTGYDILESGNMYLQIYSHHDGYPLHMWDELKQNWNTYEKALELVLAGDTSGVYDGKSAVYSKSEGYESNKPRNLKKPSYDEQYLYVFENNAWIAE